MKKNKRIWIDVTNTPHVHVLLPIIHRLENTYEIFTTARDFSETIPLLRKNGIEPIVIGKYMGNSRIKKIMGLFYRIFLLYFKLPRFDIAISLGGNYTSVVSYLRKKISIIISDNDISFKFFTYTFGKYFIFPSYFHSDKLVKKYKIPSDRILKFDGFKENIYLADYKPDPDFLGRLPFKEFITIRPENLKASYVPKNSTSIIPELFKIFKNENILFLPRYEEEKVYAKGYDNIFMPDEPLSGLDVCYYTKGMFTGAGTFAREAALMGKPAVSFFPGKQFLTVDEIMIEKKWIFKSRIPKDIYNYFQHSSSKIINVDHQQVLDEVMHFISRLVHQYCL